MITYRIHGDNIVECERIANIIINTLNPRETTTYLSSPSTIIIPFRSVCQGHREKFSSFLCG